ncbi:hypothetical protein EIN_206760 [Entamoeba invadens IP1]|uniref:Uncharacterized protein n=1 Tax=Entamoeba invadens IP1 TaxID=370355 RepID=A0A0A1U9Q6_ENTIV|nr:hypothetical protein EIN_206760 [Entamoeba invadens IP1]ELP91659.1 hypothetical protein EIN_206760 [Entamoeba invadens IP1]|eukprot:XP_004258430.1 hypothetical protein EIN_206760 [Entamoeba invadens IP1]
MDIQLLETSTEPITTPAQITVPVVTAQPSNPVIPSPNPVTTQPPQEVPQPVPHTFDTTINQEPFKTDEHKSEKSSKEEKDDKPKEDIEVKSQGFRKSRNYQTEQQGVFIALLNMFYDVTIEHPRKKSKITLPFFTVIKIESDEEAIDVRENVGEKMSELHRKDVEGGCSEKTAARRQEVYRVAEQLHILMDLLRDVGFDLDTKTTTGNKSNVKETVRQLSYENYIFDGEFVEGRGADINELIVKRLEALSKSTNLVIKKGDPEIVAILKGLNKK